MLITICDVPEQFESKIVSADGVVVREWGGLLDVQFKNHKMRVANDYVRIWKPRTPYEAIFYRSQFSNIYVQ